MSRLFLLVIVSLVIFYSPAYGQQGVWRKRVVRNLYLPCEKNKEGHRIVTKDWQLFFKQLIEDVKRVKFPVYKTWTWDPSEIIDSFSLNYEHGEDSVTLVDPVTGKEYTKARDRSSHYEYILQFRLSEEWAYYPETGKTTIKIIAIAPAKDVYGEDTVYRGSQAMCLIKWDDFQKYLKKYTALDIAHKLGEYIATDYLKDTAIISNSINTPTYDTLDKSWKISGLRHVTVFPDTFIDGIIGNNYFDTPIVAILYNSALSGKIAAYKNMTDLKKPVLPTNELKEITRGPINPIVVEESIIGPDRLYKMRQMDFCFECCTKLYIKEKWTLNTENGYSEILNEWIAPIQAETNATTAIITGTPIFWFKYGDVRNILARYNEYHPVQNLEYQLWDERFKEPKHKPLCEQN